MGDKAPVELEGGSPKPLARQSSKVKKEKKEELAAQTENFNTPGTIWYAVKTGDVESAAKIAKENKDVIYARGPVGETPLHLCYLFNAPAQKIIARKLVELDPKSISAIYEHPLYKGETVLHIAIVNKDLTTVQWMLEKNIGLLEMTAVGAFFQPATKEGEVTCYYGEYPLAFAVCTNNVAMVKYLLSMGADLYLVDSHGNTLLHLCVIHKLDPMYAFVLEEEKKWEEDGKATKDGKNRTKLSKVLNKDFYTPLTLAAYLGDLTMFDFIYQKQKETQWSYGPVTCDIYPLDELDTLKAPPLPGEPEHNPRAKSALEIIVREEHLDLLMLKRVVDLLHYKWTAYAGTYFYWKRCFLTSFYVAVFSIAVVLYSPNFSYDFTDYHTYIRVICEIFIVIGWAYKGYKEGRELLESKLQYFNQAGSAFLENNLSFCFLICVPLAVILEGANSDAKYFFVFMATLFLWTYELTLLLGFRLTGPFVIMIYKMLTRDIARFLCIYLLILFGHTSAWFCIQQAPQIDPLQEPFHEYFDRLHNDFMILFGSIDFNLFAGYMYPEYAWLSSILLLFHIIFVFIMLLNLLIGMMGNTYGEIRDNADQEWHLAYAQIIFSVESEIESSKVHEAPYWTTIADKRYLQVQDVNDKFFGDVIPLEEDIPKQSLAEQLMSFDADNNGILDAAELSRAQSQLGLELKKDSSRTSDKEVLRDGDAAADVDTENIGITDGPLKGRLDPSLTEL